MKKIEIYRKFLPSLVPLILSLGNVVAVGDEVDPSAWAKPFYIIIEEQRTAPPEVAIPRLGSIVASLSNLSDPKVGQAQVLQEARNALIQIPGYADYFAKEIKRLTDADMAHSADAGSSDRRTYINIFREIRTPESVKFLGDLLYDSRDPTGGALSDCPYVPNAVAAVDCLHKLNLKDPPEGSPEGSARKDVPVWKHWYEDVKAGKRNFFFKGSDTIYTLDGPLTNKPQLPEANEGNEGNRTSDKFSLMILFGILFLALVILLSRRKVKSDVSNLKK